MSIAGHSIGLSFFCTSTVRLLIGQNLDENYKTKVSVSGIKFFSVKLSVNYLSITKKNKPKCEINIQPRTLP